MRLSDAEWSAFHRRNLREQRQTLKEGSARLHAAMGRLAELLTAGAGDVYELRRLTHAVRRATCDVDNAANLVAYYELLSGSRAPTEEEKMDALWRSVALVPPTSTEEHPAPTTHGHRAKPLAPGLGPHPPTRHR